jgi:murein DD-endopeptidase MepM/ murein hydrolase activator NlpD
MGGRGLAGGRDGAARVAAVGSDELAAAVAVELPLRGEWTVVTTPAHRIPSHGTDALGVRYAYDLLRLDARGRYHPGSAARLLLGGVPTQWCYGWGEPVHAPFDAVVVSAGDGAVEPYRVHPLCGAAHRVSAAATFRPTHEGARRVMGNHVVLESGGLFAAFAHLAPGSIVVSAGDRVRRGQVVSRVGHTGNSTSPHLHFQLMDGPDPLTARGVPCAFRRYEGLRDGRWELVERGIPRRLERIRSIA